MFLVVLYFAIMLLPCLPLLIAAIVMAFENQAGRYRRLTEARAALERIGTAVEPIPASA